MARDHSHNGEMNPDGIAPNGKSAGGSAPPGDPYYPAQQSSGKERFEESVDLLYRRKWTMLLTLLVVLAAVAAYIFVREPVYQARSIVRLELSAPSAEGNEEGSVVEEAPFATNERSLSAELFLLRITDALHQRVLHRLESTQVDTSGEVVYRSNGHVEFQVADNAANAIMVVGTSEDPQDATLLANLYAEEYVQLTRQASRAHLSAIRNLLEEQEAEWRVKLTQIEERIEAFKMEEGISELGQKSTTLVSQISNLELQRNNARLEKETRRARLQSLMQELSALDAQLANQITSDSEQRLRTLQEEVAALRAEKDQTERRYPNPEDRKAQVRAKLRQLNQRIKEAQQETDRLATHIIAQGSSSVGGTGAGAALARASDLRRMIQQERAGIEALENGLRDVEDRLSRFNAEIRAVPEKARGLAQLERTRQYREQMFQSVALRLREARIAEASEPGYAHILRRARVPEEPISAGALRVGLLGLFFGLSMSLGLAFLRDKLDKRLYKPEQVREQVANLIGLVPNMRPLIKEDHRGAAFVEQDGHRFATSLVTLLNPMASIAEAYRRLQTRIQHGGHNNSPQVLLITSPGMAEGKSTTAANLAVAAVQAGLSTLLIDADLRRPQVHTLLGLQHDRPNLAGLLVGEATFDFEATKTVVDGLHVLTAWDPEAHSGEVVSNPVGLLESARMKALVTYMRSVFDLVIIDTPPLLAATDAAVLSTQCDTTLLVVRAGKTREDELSYAIEELEEVGASIAGVVLNAFDVSNAYGHKYKFQNYTKYGQYSKYGYYSYGMSERTSPFQKTDA